MKIKLGFSTCPNDTFMFDALVHGRIDTGDIEYEITLADIFHLNEMAMNGELDMVKISYNTLAKIQDNYHLLDAGSALGFACGPLLISREPMALENIANPDWVTAIPGFNTTANLLLDFYNPKIANRKEMIFHEVMPSLLNGEADLGLIIHENRFTYQGLGLHLVQDLGEYWEQKTGLPIPLGAIVARKTLGLEIIQRLERQMRQSVQYAFDHPDASRGYSCAHAQEMDEVVMKAHIDLYVNKFSLSLGEQGRAAVEALLEVSRRLSVK